MSLTKKKDQPKAASAAPNQTVVVQPVVVKDRSNPNPNLNKRGEPYLTGRQVAAGIATFIPLVATSFSVVDNIEDAGTKIHAEGLKGKAKAKVITKTAAKVGVKFIAGVVAGHCVYQQLDNTFNLKK